MNKDVRIAITGASGFLATQLIETLDNKGFSNLLLLTRDKSKIGFTQFDICEVDMTNPFELSEVLSGVEFVFHTAAWVSFSDKDADKIIEANVEMTSHLVNSAKRSGVKKIIYTSSIAALGGMKEGKMYIDETTLLDDFSNTSAYGKSKFLCENQMLRAQEMGIKTVIVNPGVIVGEGGTLISHLQKGVPFYTYGVTGYVDVRDVALAQVLLMQSEDAEGESFVLVGDNLSFKDLISMSGSKPWLRITKPCSEVIWRIESLLFKLFGREPMLTKSSVRAAHTKSYYNGTKIHKYVDFKYTPIKTTIQRALNN